MSSAQLPPPQEAPDLRKTQDEADPRDAEPILPPDCPVVALGFNGQTQYLLDHAHQLVALAPRNMGKGELLALFGGKGALWKIWPTKKEDKETGLWETVDFNQKRAQEDLLEACALAGIFDPQGRLFGRGAHYRMVDGALVFHLGNRVLVIGERKLKSRKGGNIREYAPGWIEREIYPALEKLDAPADEPSDDAEAQMLHELLGEWLFAQPEAARLLLVGWVGQAYICGALSWRAHVWLTGETAAGKSTLQKLIRAILGRFGLFTEDASEPSVRQTLKDDTLPVMIDEAEADDNSERQRAMINLARKASSGAKIHRGGADHKAKEFTAQSAFLFSSILHSPLDPQDRNRFAVLSMKSVPDDKEPLELDLSAWRETGARFHRRMIEQWPRFDRTLTDYKKEIARNGFAGRWTDTFGTLLACADMLMHGCAPRDESEANASHGREIRWVKTILPLMLRGRIEAESTTERCIAHLVSSTLPPGRGDIPEAIGKWVQRATYPDPETGDMNKEAREKLRNHGMRVVNLTMTEKGGTGARDAMMPESAYLAIAYATNVAMRDIFRGSKWYGGGWTQALALVEDAHSCVPMRFAGKKENAVCIPVRAVLGDMGDE